MHWWSEEEKVFLRQHYPSHSQKELLDMFNEHFNVAVGTKQLSGALKRYNIKSGRTGRFENGQKSWNKGMKGLDLAGENGKKTQFKKGQAPINYRLVGSERVDRDGYLLIKVQDDGPWHKRWRHKHRLVWEKANGPIPKGHVIIFGDGNKMNLEPNNLILVSRKQLVTLNKNNLIQNNIELTKTGGNDS